MRVALNLEQLFQRPPGGIGRYAAELARVLPTVGEAGEVVVLPFVARHKPEEVAEVLQAAGIGLPDGREPVVLPYPRRMLYELWNRWGMIDPVGMVGAKGRVRAPDVVHAPSVAVPPRERVPLVVTVHDAAPLRFPDTYPRRGRRFHKLGFDAAAMRADAIVAPTAVAADEVAEYTAIARERIRPIHHGVDHTLATDDEVAQMRDELGIDDRPYVCWAGTLEPRKDVGLLVDAFARAVETQDLPHRLVLVGPSGWLDGQEEVAGRAESLGERVRFTGSVEPSRLRALYRGADVFALPSRHEGFGLPALEALAQGTTVLASDLPVLREVAGEAARFAPVGDVDAWAVSLAGLLDDPVTRSMLGAAGVARAAEFTWERCAREHLEVYRSVV